MRYRMWLLAGCLSPLAGCHLAKNISHNLHNEPAQYFDDEHVEKQLRKEARAAFAEVKRQYPHRFFGDDFQEGFIEGYSDYLNHGGKAELPAMPPLKYRRAKYLNPEGHAQIRDWFLGFKYGMDVAVATGCRPFYTFPILTTDPKELPSLDITVLPAPPSADAPLPKPGTKPSPTAAPLPNPNPLVPGLGNPVAEPKSPLPNTVPVPLPNSPEKPAVPPGGGPGKSAQMPMTGEIVPVGAVYLSEWPGESANSGPILSRPAAAAPIFELPPARPPLR
jgi:hypothetical protein